MKVLLLGLLLVGAYAAEWDLADVSSNDWTKAAASVGGSNQGYKARYTTQGKLLKLSLAVHKEKDVRVTDTDRLLFGMDGTPSQHLVKMANTTVSRADTEELCKRALGADWAKMVTLPAEDLSYVESLRLATSLNEYNLLKAGSPIRKNQVRSYGHESESHEATFPSDFDCICHSTSHRFPWADPTGDAHDTPFWGVKILQRYTRHTDPGHSVHGIPNCILCDHLEIGSDSEVADGFNFDCRWCCSGECVIGLPNENDNANNPGWINCNAEFRFDQFRVTGMAADDITFNYFLINDVGNCRLPRVYHCIEEVTNRCADCAEFLSVLTGDSDSDSEFLEEFENCHYCDLVVGANPFICNNCSHAMDNIRQYQDEFRNPTDGGCSCENAMFQVAENERYHHEGDHHENHYEHEGDHYESYDYDYRGYDYRGDGDHHEGDHYESHDYRPSDYDYDYSRYEGDHHEGDHHESHDYARPYDYDYRGYDYRYEGDHEGDHYESHDYRPSDYDYRPYDYDYRGYDYRYEGDHEGDHYESHDYRPSDYDYRGNDYRYDYRPADYDYRGDGYESHDYRPSDYDYRSYDYNYRG